MQPTGLQLFSRGSGRRGGGGGQGVRGKEEVEKNADELEMRRRGGGGIVEGV